MSIYTVENGVARFIISSILPGNMFGSEPIDISYRIYSKNKFLN